MENTDHENQADWTSLLAKTSFYSFKNNLNVSCYNHYTFFIIIISGSPISLN
jgi:hypothetical protein